MQMLPVPSFPAAFSAAFAVAFAALPVSAQGTAANASAATPRPAWAASLDSLIGAEITRTGTPGVQVVVVAGGKLAYSGAFGYADLETKRPVTAQTLFRVGSVTKMVTAAALTQMAAQGTVDLHAPIGRYVPEIAGKRVAAVTTHHLLTHSAGWLDNATAYGRMGEGALGEVFREVTDTLFFTEPGRIISYSNPGYSMAGYVAEQAGKARFGDIAEQLVLRRMGMPRATFRPLFALTHDFSHGYIGPAPVIVRPFTENTAQWAAGFLFTSAEELARFTIAMMDGGRLDGQPVMAPEAITMMTTGHMAIPGSDDRYGYGLRIGTVNGERVWQHGGSINGFDAQVTMFPDKQVAVLVFDNRSGSPLRGIVDAAARHAAGIAPGAAPETPPAPREATAAERAAIVGEYRNGGVRLAVAEENGALVLRQGANAFPVQLVGSERIIARAGTPNATTFLLVKDASGKVQFLHGGLRSLSRQP